jgi:hypothetical protein
MYQKLGIGFLCQSPQSQFPVRATQGWSCPAITTPRRRTNYGRKEARYERH